TAVAGAVYIFNDVNDIEEDRNHPEKQHRPIASGQVSVPTALLFASTLVVAGFGAAYLLDIAFLIILSAYAVQNILYSTHLKDIPILDVLLVAIGFVLRAIAGVVAINVFLSPWLIVCTFLLALVLAFGKRRHELAALDDISEGRDTLKTYSKTTLDQYLSMVTAMLLMAYVLYTFFRAERAMMLTIPFAFFGVFRYHHLLRTTDIGGQPEYLFTDRLSLINLLIWGVLTVAVLYDAHHTILEMI
ncbi:MAG: UbiA prenyltransferase family protein, partial [Halobacteriaceae archaeon]